MANTPRATTPVKTALRRPRATSPQVQAQMVASAPLEELDDEAPESGTFITALARGLSVMRAFTSQSQHLTLADVARIVNLPRASVRRCLLTLQALGYVESRDRYFSLSPRVLTIAQAYLTSSVLPRVSQSFLERLSEQ